MVIFIGASSSSSTSSLSWVSSPSISSSYVRRISKKSLTRGLFCGKHYDMQQLTSSKGKSSQIVHGTLTSSGKVTKKSLIMFASSEDHSSDYDLGPNASKQENQHFNAEDISSECSSVIQFQGTEGKPGYISFYRRPYKRKDEILEPVSSSHSLKLQWFIGPTVLVAAFIFPSLYLRRILSTVFEDSLLTDFLILFFTEALFYGGVAIFLKLIDHLQRPFQSMSLSTPKRNNGLWDTQLVYRISSIAALVLSLIIPMVTMGLVWPWTGPAASATLAPYLVGIVMQFAFERYARYFKSPSWPVIPVIFQVYRLHQLNRAAQLVTALSFTVRGAETTAHNLAINSSLGTLLKVLQFLGVICIWSLANFLMRFFPSSSTIADS